MPSLSYATRELRRRRGRTVTTAFGLACGVGLVMGIVGVSDGLDDAQRDVLSPLRSVGTDILVTRTVAATASSGASPSPSPSATSAPQQQGGFFGGPGGPSGGRGGALSSLAALEDADATALLNENSSVLTDLSTLGEPGETFTHDFFLAGTLITFPDEALDVVREIEGVTSATGALTLQAQHQSGTVPEIVAEVQTGGETLTTTARPADLTAEEQAAVQDCIAKNGGFGATPASPRARPTGAPSGGFQGGGRELGGFGAIQTCLPKRFQEYQANVITPLRTISQIVDPPQTDTTSESYTAAGVDRTSTTSGLITEANVAQGTWFTGDTDVLVSTAYAGKKDLAVGGTLDVNGTAYTIRGLVDPTLTGNTADVYFTLDALQSLASKDGRVNEVLVRVADAGDVEAVATAIAKALPGAQVVTGKDVADTVTGSLQDAQTLASRLGGVLAVIVLLAAFAIAVLLTLSSVAKRVREIGTLRALGWSRRRVVGQIVTETLGIGLLGGALGIGLGYVASIAVEQLSPSLSATTAGVAAGASSVSGLFGQEVSAVTREVSLTAPITPSTIALGMACALAGGLLAGTVGGWRAARLSPSVALRDLG
jgi:hypothetical protein